MALIQISSGRGPLECELAVGLYRSFFLKQHPGAIVRKEERGKTVTALGKRFTAYKSVLLEVVDAQNIRTGAVQWICQSPVRPKGVRRTP